MHSILRRQYYGVFCYRQYSIAHMTEMKILCSYFIVMIVQQILYSNMRKVWLVGWCLFVCTAISEIRLQT
jgi:hypothetical protein